MLVGAKVCDLTEDLLWFVCGNFDVFPKLFTSLINQRLSKFLDSNSLLGEEQAGFPDGYSTIDHTLTLNLIIEYLLSKHKRLYCAFVDYHKAFHTVDRTHLWTKLFSTGIHGRILNVVKNIYKEAQSCVRHNGEVSQLLACNNGVRQGTTFPHFCSQST